MAPELRKLAPWGRVLEVGCALGFLPDGVRRYCDWEVTGVDVSEFGIYFARRRYELDAHCATLEELAFEDGFFDYLVQKDLLEHVPDPLAHLMEAARVLKSGGRTWLITPNGDGNILPLQRIEARITARTTGHTAARIAEGGEDRLPLIDQGHLSFFRLEHLRTLFDECGFEIVKARSIDIKRGMRALGMLPMKSKSYQTGPKGNVRRTCNDEQLKEFSGSGSAGGHSGAIGGSAHHISGREAAMARVYDQIVSEMERNAKPLRSTPAYFQFRRLSGLFDSVPASNRWGNDFEFVLQKR